VGDTDGGWGEVLDNAFPGGSTAAPLAMPADTTDATTDGYAPKATSTDAATMGTISPMTVPDDGGGGGGGCAGPGFSMPDPMVEAGMPATWYPLAACEGQMATIADYCRKVCLCLLVVFAVVKTIELIQSGLGLSTHVQLTSGADWSGAQRWK
ncbi:MAG TPA: hypothetical protein VFQ37_16670, partial [Mycobacterium sp.]|nr:hypothetical protein [Mycobacterium sp.]